MDLSSLSPSSFCLLLLFLLLISFPDVILSGLSPNRKKPNKQIITTRIPSQSATNMVESELDTLFHIMEKMSSDQAWRSTYPNPCKQGPSSSWPGIECKLGYDNRLHVTRLDFGNTPNPTCKNTATFPSEIFTLPFLQSAFFFNCFTHTRTTITLPVDSLLNSTLERLSLRSNSALMGRIPPQFSSLKSLKVFTLSQNQLTGPVPLQIFGLSSLVRLDLSYNMLTGSIPSQVGNLRNLVGLDLSYNSFVGRIPSTIGQLGLLQKLDLSSNRLVGMIPPTIEKLTSLAFIALSNNHLRGRFPSGLSKLVNLQYFLMDDNPMFIRLPEEFGLLLRLLELRLANSGYSGTIPHSFGNLMNLTTLSLESNRLTGKIPIGLSSLSHIYHLNLSRNFLEGVVPFNGSFLKRLDTNLDLSGNPGLCLDPRGANTVKVGDVSVCGRQKINSVLQPGQLHSKGFDLRYHLNGLFFPGSMILLLHFLLCST